MFFRLAPAAVMALAAQPASAAPLELKSRIMVEQRAAGRDGATTIALVDPGKVMPGDRVVFVLAYRNTGAQPIAGLVLANPLPSSIAYSAAAEGSPAPELSVDGTSFGALPTLRVRGPDGTSRAATTSDVVAVRWRLSRPLAAGAGAELRFQAVVK